MGYKAKIEVVYNGIPADFVTTKPYRAKNNSFDKIVIGAVGRIDYAKDYINLVESFAQVYKLHNNIELRIVGSVRNEAYLVEIKNIIRMSGLENVVVFLPETDNIGEFYSNIDIFVSSSFTEGFSNVVAEAMLHQLPCVVTDAGDSKILIADAGIVVERRNHSELARAMQELIVDEDLRKELSKKAKKRIIDQFSVEKMVENTLSYIKELK